MQIVFFKHEIMYLKKIVFNKKHFPSSFILGDVLRKYILYNIFWYIFLYNILQYILQYQIYFVHIYTYIYMLLGKIVINSNELDIYFWKL